jgi:hypothetical protein
MSATYDIARSRPIDRVRARVRDTGQFDVAVEGVQPIKGAISTDEEIARLILDNGEQEAAARLAEEHAAYYNLEPTRVEQKDGISFSYGDRAKALLQLAAAIRSQGSPGRGSGRYGNVSPTLTVPNDVQY